ncbi:MAG: nucleotidyl transferase AbiEii/AbiGii toxin family protein [Nitriliruptorales bacterium]
MPGEQVILVGDAGRRIRSFVNALGRFPTDPLWVVVGGFAVNVRISEVHRLTNDLDTITSSQAQLVEILLDAPDADRLDHAKLRFTGEMPEVDIDVMDDTAGDPLPAEPSDRVFALARRQAMEARETLEIVVVDAGRVSAEASAPVASVPSLIALKSVSMPRRSASNHPEKVGSDIHDLVRLVEGRDIDELAQALAGVDGELANWIGTTLVQWFSADADQRYTFARLRRLSGGTDVRSIDEGALDVVAMLGRAVLDNVR